MKILLTTLFFLALTSTTYYVTGLVRWKFLSDNETLFTNIMGIVAIILWTSLFYFML